ncbi:MAG: hypothetical protein ACK5AA_03610, partial [Akkermansiaceae bacterium]
ARRKWEASAAVLTRHCAPLRCVLGPPLQLPSFESLPNTIRELLSMIYDPSHASKHQSLV